MSLVQIVFGSFGMGDHDVHMDHEIHTDHDHGGTSADQSLNLRSVRALSAGLALFGAAGGITLSLAHNHLLSLFVAALFGWLGAYAMAWLMSKLTTFDSDGTMKVGNATGSAGRAYVTMAPGQVGMALVNIQGRTMKMSARNGSGDTLESGDPLKVLEMQGEVAVVVPPSAQMLHG